MSHDMILSRGRRQRLCGGCRYAGIWEKTAGSSPLVRTGLSADEYQKESDQLRQEGYRPVALAACAVTGEP